MLNKLKKKNTEFDINILPSDSPARQKTWWSMSSRYGNRPGPPRWTAGTVRRSRGTWPAAAARSGRSIRSTAAAWRTRPTPGPAILRTIQLSFITIQEKWVNKNGFYLSDDPDELRLLDRLVRSLEELADLDLDLLLLPLILRLISKWSLFGFVTELSFFSGKT